jgi:hypothetical protein
MVFSTTFNNISVISWQSGLLVEETRVPRENLLEIQGIQLTSPRSLTTSPCELSERELTSPSNLKVVGALGSS